MLKRTPIFVLVAIPAIAALGVGFWLSSRIQSEARQEVERTRAAEVITQDRLLVEAMAGAIESLKVQALSLWDVRHAQGTTASPPTGAILHWAELSFEEGAAPSVRQTAKGLAWAGGDLERLYLESALTRINLKELKEHGVTLLRVRQDPQLRDEWLAFGFEGRKSGSVLLVLVDPAQTFSIFGRWAQRSEAGRLRGYLVGSDGVVIAHSEPSYVASDFSSTQLFSEGVGPMLQGRVVRGAGVYRGIDQVALNTAYARAGALPLGVVVERVQAADESVMARAPWGGLIAAIAGVLALCLGVSAWMHRRILAVATKSLRAAQKGLETHRVMADEAKAALMNPTWRPAQEYERVSAHHENANQNT